MMIWYVSDFVRILDAMNEEHKFDNKIYIVNWEESGMNLFFLPLFPFKECQSIVEFRLPLKNFSYIH